MFTEVVKLVPNIDRAGLNRMFQSLTQRFASVAKKFGDGMKNALKFGGIIAVVSGLVAKLLNPLEKAEEIINRITGKGSDTVTNAQEFGTTPGKLLRLEGVAAAHGVNAETLHQLLTKFQSSLAAEQEAAVAPARIQAQLANETDPGQRKILEAELVQAKATAARGGTLHEFINEKDISQAFFSFIQSLQKVTPERRTVVQNEVFGEKVRGKATEFFNATDFADILKRLPTAEVLGQAAEKSGKVADLNNLLTAIREQEDFVTKSKLVNEGQVQAIDQSERLKNQADNQTLTRFDSLKSSSIAIQELTAKFDAFTTDFLANAMPTITKGIGEISSGLAVIMPVLTDLAKSLPAIADSVLNLAANISVALTDWLDTAFESTFQKISDSVTAITNLWDEFKSSRIYRTFGGGK